MTVLLLCILAAVLLAFGFEMFLVMGVPSILAWLLFYPAIPPIVIAQKLLSGVNVSTLLAIPFFVFAADIMARMDFGFLPVGEDDRLVGMLTDRDITVRAVARGLPPGQCKVREIMTPDVKYVYEDDSLEEAAASMSNLQVRRLPVLNREKRLVGVVSLGDLSLVHPRPAGDALQSISQPEQGEPS